jgi:hypothetical protein
MYYVQLHERAWGLENYRGRPSLESILEAPVVVLWASDDKAEDRFTITLHDNLQEIEKLFVRMLLGSVMQHKRVMTVFQHRKRMMVKQVRVLFDEVDG